MRLRELFRAWHVAWLTPVLLVCGVLLAIRLLFWLRRSLQDRLRQIVGHLTPWRVSRRTLLTGMGWAWTVWILDATRLALAALAFRSMLGITQAAALSLAYNIGAAVPVMGGLGAVESSLTAVLCLFGVSRRLRSQSQCLSESSATCKERWPEELHCSFGRTKLLRSAKTTSRRRRLPQVLTSGCPRFRDAMELESVGAKVANRLPQTLHCWPAGAKPIVKNAGGSFVMSTKPHG